MKNDGHHADDTRGIPRWAYMQIERLQVSNGLLKHVHVIARLAVAPHNQPTLALFQVCHHQKDVLQAGRLAITCLIVSITAKFHQDETICYQITFISMSETNIAMATLNRFDHFGCS